MGQRRPTPWIAVAIALLFAASSVRAFSHNDAGTGTDAGDSKSSALALAAFGAYAGDLASASDKDWYARTETLAGGTCVVAGVDPDAAITSTLRLNTPSGTRTVTIPTAANAITNLGIAVPSLTKARLGLDGAPSGVTHYDFTLQGVTAPTTGTGDAGTQVDAGSTVATALAAQPGCTTGRLVPSLGNADIDLLSFNVEPDTTFYYSIAGTESGITVTLVDAAGSLIGPAAAPNDLVAVALAQGGTYHLRVTSSSTTTESGYVTGVVGVIEPGSPCRPYCIIQT